VSEVQVMWVYVQYCWARARDRGADETGAVTLEQVMWAAITVVGVVAVATILWAKFRDKANAVDTNTPSKLP